MNIKTINSYSPVPNLYWLQENNIHPASPSSVGTHETCRRKWDSAYKGISVDKVEPSYGEAAEYGVDCHLNVELYLRGQAKRIQKRFIDDLPNLMTKVNWVKDHPEFDRELVEVRLSMNSDGKSTWNERTIGAIADVKMRLSASHTLFIDWKTNNNKNAKGKPRSPYPKPLQLEMLATTLNS